jgi:hypothetical protein
MYPHRIRLRGPWEYDAGEAHGKLALPAATPLAGAVRFSRRFGYPGRIDGDERVWLVLDGLAGPATVALNGTELGSARGDAEFDVTSRLQPRNEVAVTLSDLPAGGSPWQEVCLEVRRTAFLRDVRAWIEEDTLHAAGRVVGHSQGPLDLYVVADRSSAAYTSLTPLEGGQAFHLAGSPSGPVSEVRVELVQGAVVWYVVRPTLERGSGA